MTRILVYVLRWLGFVRYTHTWLDASILACAYPKTEASIAWLAAQGVSVIVNLHAHAHSPERLARYGLVQVHLPTRDFTSPKPADLIRGIDAIECALAEERRVAVHCGGGLGRTGTLLACYLVRRGMSADAAIERIRKVRPGSVETAAQSAAVRTYASVLQEDQPPN